MSVSGTRQGGPLGVLRAGWAAAEGRVRGSSLEERMRTEGRPVVAKTPTYWMQR